MMNQRESLITGIKFENRRIVEECPDKKVDGFGRFWGFNCENGDSQGYRWELNERVSDDVADLLPPDPFDMDIGTTVTGVTRITGLIEGIEKDRGLKTLGFEADEIEVGVGEVDNQLFAGFNFIWNTPIANNQKMGGAENSAASCAMDFGNGLFNSHLLFDGKREEFMGFHYEKYCFYNDATNIKHQGITEGDFGGAVAPPDALFLALGKLGVKDLLSVERVCKSLCDSVQTDPLLWRSIHIDHSLSDKITDDALLKLTNRAQGNLNSLSLVECSKISENSLKLVLERNPRLAKLSVAGCTKLRLDSLLSIFKSIKCAGNLGIKCLRIGGLFGITNEQFEELKILLGVNNSQLPTVCKLHFYRGDQLYLPLDDGRAIDIEICPRCQELRLVYDCPSESCQKMQHGNQLCRACILCVPRCISCGCCLSNCEYEETFCLENLCFSCIKEFLPKHAFFHQQASYHFFVCG
nr:F-box protein SKIP14-like [Ipomoea batatas]